MIETVAGLDQKQTLQIAYLLMQTQAFKQAMAFLGRVEETPKCLLYRLYCSLALAQVDAAKQLLARVQGMDMLAPDRRFLREVQNYMQELSGE